MRKWEENSYIRFLLTIKTIKMKKIILILGVGALMSFTLNSCSKCATCSDSSGFYSGEICKGNAIEDAIYQSAKIECEVLGGTFD